MGGQVPNGFVGWRPSTSTTWKWRRSASCGKARSSRRTFRRPAGGAVAVGTAADRRSLLSLYAECRAGCAVLHPRVGRRADAAFEDGRPIPYIDEVAGLSRARHRLRPCRLPWTEEILVAVAHQRRTCTSTLRATVTVAPTGDPVPHPAPGNARCCSAPMPMIGHQHALRSRRPQARDKLGKPPARQRRAGVQPERLTRFAGHAVSRFVHASRGVDLPCRYGHSVTSTVVGVATKDMHRALGFYRLGLDVRTGGPHVEVSSPGEPAGRPRRQEEIAGVASRLDSASCLGSGRSLSGSATRSRRAVREDHPRGISAR